MPSKSTTKNETLRNVVQSTLEFLGGRASAEEVARVVMETHPALYHDYVFGGWRQTVAAALRAKDHDGLPYAKAIDFGGEQKVYVQRALFDVEMYRQAAVDLLRSAYEDETMARRLVDECFDKLHVPLDWDELLREARGLS